jgi:transcription elongation factor/antiterminator RfaH
VPRWYVVYTQPHREISVEQHLRAQDFHTYLPTHWKTTRHARQFRTAKAPFFPRYLFVKLVIGRDRWRSVNGTFGVSHMIMTGDRPKPVPAGVVEDLVSLVGTAGMLSFENVLQAGQPIRLLSGPFAGCIGTLTRLTPAGRVQVLLEIMGSRVAVSAPKDTLAILA